MKNENKIINPFKEQEPVDKYSQLDSLVRSHTHDGRETQSTSGKTPIITSGSGAPTSIPKKLGDIYVRTDTSKIYMATGVSASADWTILN